MKGQLIHSAFVGVLVLISTQVVADFDVVEQRNERYGNAQSQSFHRAISGGSRESSEDAQMIAAIRPEKIEGNYYGRFRVGFNNLAFDNMSNKSSGSEKDGTFSKKRTSNTQTGLEMAVGYGFSKNVRMDVEYIANKNLVYEANPVLSGTGITDRAMSAWIKNNTLLFNGYYEYTNIYRFFPYITLGAGISVTSVPSLLEPAPTGESSNSRKMSLAWSFGTGVRINIFKKWFLDASYRYISLGTKIPIKPGGNYKFEGDYSSNVMSIGFIYLF